MLFKKVKNIQKFNDFHVYLDNMKKMIDTSDVKFKKVVTRYIGLNNRILNKIFEKSGDWGIIGGSVAIENLYEDKFGSYIPENELILFNINYKTDNKEF